MLVLPHYFNYTCQNIEQYALCNTAWQETFEGENFCKFRGFVAIHESFLCKIGGVVSFGGDTSEQSAKLFSVKILFSTNSREFSLLKVSRYRV